MSKAHFQRLDTKVFIESMVSIGLSSTPERPY